MAVTPLQAALDVLDRAQALLALDPGTEGATLVQYDIRRQAVAMAVAALDTWMHWSIRRVDLRSLSVRLSGLEVPFGALVRMGDRSVAARKAGVEDRPQTRARNALNEKILTMTFQTARQWEFGFDLLAIRQGLTRTGQAMTPQETHAVLKKHLDGLSHRRNQIVHEGDLERLMRPRRIKRGKLPRVEADADLTWIRKFLVAVDTLQ